MDRRNLGYSNLERNVGQGKTQIGELCNEKSINMSRFFIIALLRSHGGPNGSGGQLLLLLVRLFMLLLCPEANNFT